MIDRITGTISEICDDHVKIFCSGITYDILISGGFSHHLRSSKKKGDPLEIFTILYIENSMGGSAMHPKLIGFNSNIEREFFEKYTTVKGLGIKSGLKSFVLSVRQLAQAIENSELKIICKLPGIGRRTAEKIIAELRGRVTKYALIKENPEETAVDDSAMKNQEKRNSKNKNLEAGVDELEKSMKNRFEIEEEAYQILTELGYGKNEISELIQLIFIKYPEIENSEDVIREIFKQQKK